MSWPKEARPGATASCDLPGRERELTSMTTFDRFSIKVVAGVGLCGAAIALSQAAVAAPLKTGGAACMYGSAGEVAAPAAAGAAGVAGVAGAAGAALCARRRPDRGHGRCAGGSPAAPRCSYSGRCSYSRRTSFPGRRPSSRGRPTARCRSGWCSADRVGRPAGCANRGHGRCRRRQRCVDGFGADERPDARPAAAAWSHWIRPQGKAPRVKPGGFSLSG